MRDRLTLIKDTARDVEEGNRRIKVLARCIIMLVEEIRALKSENTSTKARTRRRS